LVPRERMFDSMVQADARLSDELTDALPDTLDDL
jgi:hypothetical protein